MSPPLENFKQRTAAELSLVDITMSKVGRLYYEEKVPNLSFSTLDSSMITAPVTVPTAR